MSKLITFIPKSTSWLSIYTIKDALDDGDFFT